MTFLYKHQTSAVVFHLVWPESLYYKCTVCAEGNGVPRTNQEVKMKREYWHLCLKLGQ